MNKKSILILLSAIIVLTMFSNVKAINWDYSSNKHLICDCTGDGFVDMRDISRCGKSLWSDINDTHGFGDYEYNPDCDVYNGSDYGYPDGQIDMYDLGYHSSRFGTEGNWTMPTEDPECCEATDYWTEGLWHPEYNNTWYTWQDNGTLHTKMTKYEGWNEMAMFQGEKPFGWQEETNNHVFDWIPISEYNNGSRTWMDVQTDFCYFEHYIDCGGFYPTGCGNIALDMWITANDTESSNSVVGEVMVYVKMVGLLAIMPIGSRNWQIRGSGNETWLAQFYRHSQQPYNQWVTMNFDLEGEIYQWWYNFKNDPYIPYTWLDTADIYLHCFWYGLEGNNCAAEITWDYAYTYTNTTTDYSNGY